MVQQVLVPCQDLEVLQALVVKQVDLAMKEVPQVHHLSQSELLQTPLH